MSKEYWNRACKDAISGPHKQVATSFGAVVVSRDPSLCVAVVQKPTCAKPYAHCIFVAFFTIFAPRWHSLLLLQSSAFAVCAVVGGGLFLRWWRLDSHHRLRIWKLYGWFTGLVCVGSCTGAVCYAAWAQWLYNYYLSLRPTPFTNTTLENGPEDIEAAVFYGTVSPFPDRCRC
jgi:hypothetical protein